MLRPLAILALSAVLATVAACGYRPLYGERPTGGVAADMSQVRINLIEDRSGQMLHNMLRDRLNPSGQPTAPRYELAIQLDEAFQELSIRKDATATRANFRAFATFRLYRLEDLKEVAFIGDTDAVTSYNIVESDYATLVARDDARERALRLVADRVATEVALYLNRERESEGGE